MGVLKPGTSAEEGGDKPQTRAVHQGTVATRAGVSGSLSVSEDTGVGMAPLAKSMTEQVKDLRAALAHINATGGETRHIESAKRGVVTPDIATLYVGAALRALGSIGMDLKGNQDRLAADAATLRGYQTKIRDALARLDRAQRALLPPDRWAYLLPASATKDAELKVIGYDWAKGLDGALATGARETGGALNTLQTTMNGAEGARWKAIDARRRNASAKQLPNGDWDFGVKNPVISTPYRDTMDAYVYLIETLEGIKDGEYVVEMNTGIRLTTKVTEAHRPVGKDTRMNAAKEPSTADTIADVQRAVEAAGLRDEWDALLEVGTVVIGGYQFLCSKAGINVVPPAGRAKEMRLVHPHALVTPGNLARVLNRMLALLADGVMANTRLRPAQVIALENDILGITP